MVSHAHLKCPINLRQGKIQFDSIKHYTNVKPVPRESGKNSYLNLSKASQYSDFKRHV